MAQQITQRKQQGVYIEPTRRVTLANRLLLELQAQYSNYKNGLQQIAQKIGDVEQEAEEHKFVAIPLSAMAKGCTTFPSLVLFPCSTCQYTARMPTHRLCAADSFSRLSSRSRETESVFG